jgi:hypothetical protein
MLLGEFPVIMGEAPPPEASQKRGYRIMYKPEKPKVDEEGLPRRRAAITAPSASKSSARSKTDVSSKKKSPVSETKKGTSKTAKIKLSSKAAKVKAKTKSVKAGKSRSRINSTDKGSAESTPGQSPRVSKHRLKDAAEDSEECEIEQTSIDHQAEDQVSQNSLELRPAKKQRVELHANTSVAKLSDHDGPASGEQHTQTSPATIQSTPSVEIVDAVDLLVNDPHEQKGNSGASTSTAHQNSNKVVSTLTASNVKTFYDDSGRQFVYLGGKHGMVSMSDYLVLMKL